MECVKIAVSNRVQNSVYMKFRQMTNFDVRAQIFNGGLPTNDFHTSIYGEIRNDLWFYRQPEAHYEL